MKNEISLIKLNYAVKHILHDQKFYPTSIININPYGSEF